LNNFKKFVVYPIGVICILIGLFAQLGFIDSDKLDSTELKVIPIATLIYEYSKNELRAKEKYKNTPFQVVGVYFSLEDRKSSFSSDLLVVIRESWDSSSYMYVTLPKSAKKEFINIDRGTLVSINCMNLDKYGLNPIFEKCNFIKKVDTKGERAEIFLDKLIYENNELLNPKKEDQ
jgi:hypothetical protein